MHGFDGPTLRSIREEHDVPLRKVARVANMSHGHLSKVERGEPGRPVTPHVLNAYERVIGAKLSPAGLPGGQDGDWRRGTLSNARRATMNAAIAAVATGGPFGDPLGRVLEGTGRIMPPVRVEEADVTAVQAAAHMCTTLDLRLGGAVCDQQARALLRWAVGMLKIEASEQDRLQLHAAVAALAQRAGWAAVDADSHDVARPLLRIGLYAAVRADDADLAGHVMADIAAQYNYLGYCDDALKIARLAEVDERVTSPVHMVINNVKARAYAAKGDAEACRRHLDLAGQAQVTAAGQATGWQASTATEGQLAAAAGHALATLARRTGSPTARDQAVQQLTAAAEQLGPDRARAVGLCQAQAAALHLEVGELDPGTKWAQRALETAAGVRSLRLAGHLDDVRTAAEVYRHEPHIQELLAGLRAAVLLRLAEPELEAAAVKIPTAPAEVANGG